MGECVWGSVWGSRWVGMCGESERDCSESMECVLSLRECVRGFV